MKYPYLLVFTAPVVIKKENKETLIVLALTKLLWKYQIISDNTLSSPLTQILPVILRWLKKSLLLLHIRSFPLSLILIWLDNQDLYHWERYPVSRVSRAKQAKEGSSPVSPGRLCLQGLRTFQWSSQDNQKWRYYVISPSHHSPVAWTQALARESLAVCCSSCLDASFSSSFC